MTRDELEGLIGNAIISALDESGYLYNVDEWDAEFLQDAIEDIAHIYFDSRKKQTQDYEDDEDNRKEEEALEEKRENLKN